jgi:hypothetical protein
MFEEKGKRMKRTAILILIFLVAIEAKGQQRETEDYHLKPTPKTVAWGY